MNNKISRRSFLVGLESLGVVATFGGLNYLRADETTSALPKKVDALTEKPVLTIAHCCDPQLGFGKSPEGKKSYDLDLERLEKEIAAVNAAKPDVVFFAGDMANNYKDLTKDWPRLLKEIEAPTIVAPGNHDIPDPLKRSEVEAFCEVFGAEYASIKIKGWKLIAVNSQYCRDTEETELYEKQLEWFQRELQEAKESNTPIIVGSHVPPFVKSLDEKDEYFNFPIKVRQEYLDYCVDSGMKFYLAGHTHTTLERAYRNAPILNGETTSQNFDQRPFGFRLMKIDAAMNYEWNFQAVEN